MPEEDAGPASALADLSQQLRATGRPTAKALAEDLRRFELLSSVDSEMALVRARRALDVMLRSTCRAEDIEPGTRPLDELLTQLRRAGVLPRVVESHCRVIKDFGNLAAHGVEADGEANDECLTEVEVEMATRGLETAFRWYLATVIPRLQAHHTLVALHGRSISLEQIRATVDIDLLVYRTNTSRRFRRSKRGFSAIRTSIPWSWIRRPTRLWAT